MKPHMVLLVAIIMFASIGPQQTEASASGKMRTFLFIGEPNSTAWKGLIKNPVDREKAAGVAISKLGGKMLSYYWGVGTGRNYIVIAMPDDIELIRANYLARLGDGLLVSYRMIELIDSATMTRALKRVRDVKKVDDIK
jgi:uncharacterized protein with GYD domain